MTVAARIRVTWSGTPVVGPGVSTFFLDSSVSAGWPAALVTFFTALKNYSPTGVTWQIPNDVDLIDVATGELVGANSPGGGGAVASSGGAVDYKPGVGGRIRWGTADVVGGRRVKGTTFIVPTTSQEIPNGILQGGTVAAWTTAANNYRTTAGISPSIYSRPRPARTVGGVFIPARDGAISHITSVSVPGPITWLRTRRT